MYKQNPVKIRRVMLQAFNEPEESVINGRFYFPDIPELNNTTIVGLEFVKGGFTFLSDYYLPRVNRETVVNGNPGHNADLTDARNFTVTFSDIQNNYILENFPVVALWNRKNGANKPKLILPFNFKTILRSGYVTVQNYTVSVRNLFLNFNFYYLD